MPCRSHSFSWDPVRTAPVFVSFKPGAHVVDRYQLSVNGVLDVVLAQVLGVAGIALATTAMISPSIARFSQSSAADPGTVAYQSAIDDKAGRLHEQMTSAPDLDSLTSW